MAILQAPRRNDINKRERIIVCKSYKENGWWSGLRTEGCLLPLRWHRHDSVRSSRGPNEAARAGSNQAGE